MKLSRRLIAIAVAIGVTGVLTSAFAPAEDKGVNPKIQEMMGQVSEARIKATLEKLESFGTRNTMSNADDPVHSTLEKLESFGTRNTMSNADDPVHGVGAARAWILNEFKS